MFSLIRPFLQNALHIAVYAAPLLATGYFAYDVGHTQASRLYEVKLSRQAEAHALQLRALSNAKTAELAAALTEQQRLTELAHKTGWELLQARARLADAQTRLKQRIPDATRSDGTRFTGLGPDSLRLYRAALGYASDDAHLPAADPGAAIQADQTAAPAGGLPPLALLYHAADYGRWCQQLEQQLDAWQALFPGSPIPQKGETHAKP